MTEGGSRGDFQIAESLGEIKANQRHTQTAIDGLVSTASSNEARLRGVEGFVSANTDIPARMNAVEKTQGEHTTVLTGLLANAPEKLTWGKVVIAVGAFVVATTGLDKLLDQVIK